MDALDTEQEETVTAAVLAKRLNVVDYANGFALRHCAGPRSFLTWQAGQMISEQRYMRVSALSGVCAWQSVSLFKLLGYGSSKEDAVAMALKTERDGR